MSDEVTESMFEHISGLTAENAALTAEVSRLTGELDAASARLHEVATLCATVEQERDRLTAELEKETAHSKHLAGAVSRKIDELIAAENQCGYYRMQYSRAEQVRKEACEANAKAQAAMLWLEADLERSRKECERLRAVATQYAASLGFVEPDEKLAKDLAALSAGEKDGHA